MQRGEIWHVDIDPAVGREQAHPRYVLILTPKEFNQLGIAITAPITQGGSFARSQGFTVPLSGAGTNAAGVILCHQLRALDLKARGGVFSEIAPGFIIDEVLAKVATLFE